MPHGAVVYAVDFIGLDRKEIDGGARKNLGLLSHVKKNDDMRPLDCAIFAA
jgi:hypothetical protein